MQARMDNERLTQKKQQRYDFLKKLYDKTDGKDLVPVNFDGFAEELGLNKEATRDVIQYLKGEGLVRQHTQELVSITHAGVLEVEETMEHPDRPTSHFPPGVNILHIETVKDSQIQQGTFASSPQIQFRDDEISRAFASLLQQVESLAEGPDKRDAKHAVEMLEEEARKGTHAHEGTVRRWLNFLLETAPAAGEVAVTTFINPIAGVAKVFQKVAEKAKQEREQGAHHGPN